MAVEQEDMATSDEIKEFRHEGELDTHRDALLEIKNRLALAADKPPLAAALDYILQMKTNGILPPVVVEVAHRIKQEQLLKATNALYNERINNNLPTVNLAYGIPGTHPKVNEFPTICLPSHIPNVNAASLPASYARPNWATPMLITSSQATGHSRPHQLPYYYNQNNLHYSQTFGGTTGSQLLGPQTAPAPSQQPVPPTTTSKGKSKGKKSTHIKKPLNAFMLYMKEMRAKVVQEYTLKESAAINQILGKRWHALDRSEQARFYELARRERALHMQMYPNWSARSNYASTGKKKRKRDKNAEQEAGSPKKCRARYGLDKQSSWCKPCRRKKKCVRYLQGEEDMDCKDGKCDADGEHHKPSCPAAHEPGCSVRGADSCDCNTHTCGRDEHKTPDSSCTCRLEDSKPPATPVTVVTDKDSKDTLQLASVANLSLTTSTTSPATTSIISNKPKVEPAPAVTFKTENVFTSPKFRTEFSSSAKLEFSSSAKLPAGGYYLGGMDYAAVQENNPNISTLTHFPNN